MKSLRLLSLAFFAVVAFTITSCNPDEPAEPSFTVTAVSLDAVGGAGDADILAIVEIENTSDATIDLYWIRQNVNVPTGWETAICDHNLCYPKTTAENDLQLTAGQKIELKFTFYPNGVDGNGSGDLVLYDTADQAGTTETISFTALARP